MDRYKVAVFGLGYVGLPLALFCAKRGMDVIGIDIDAKKVGLINQAKSPIEEPYIEQAFKDGVRVRAVTDPAGAQSSHIYLIAVPSDSLHPLFAVLKTIASQVEKGALIVVESTVQPGTCENRILPFLQAELNKRVPRLIVGTDVFLAHCPERINPGDEKWTVENIPRVLGASSPEGLSKAQSFYAALLGGQKVHPVSTIALAELTKVVENSFRGYNIAFANALALICERAGLDVNELMSAAATKPFAFMPHYPSRGWGGHCIPKDTKFLESFAREIGLPMDLFSAAIRQNEQMPLHTVNRLKQALAHTSRTLKGARIAVLGLAYKPEIDDTRETPAVPIIKEIVAQGAKVVVYDPFVSSHPEIQASLFASDRESAIKGADAVLLCTAHLALKQGLVDLMQQQGVKILIDGQNAIKIDPQKASLVYKGIGR